MIIHQLHSESRSQNGVISGLSVNQNVVALLETLIKAFIVLDKIFLHKYISGTSNEYPQHMVSLEK